LATACSSDNLPPAENEAKDEALNTDTDDGQRSGVDRRRFFQGAAGVAVGIGAAGSLVASASPAAAVAGPVTRAIPKIDVHAHYLPADYRQALIDNGQSMPDGFPVLPTWSPEAHLAMMDTVGIGTAMLSVTSPGALFGQDPVVWSRRINEAGAKTVRDHPGRFGFFATLPLPNVDAALTELRYAVDTLKADGVVVMTNFNEIYLGDARFDPLFAELDRRRSVMFIHPTSPACYQATALGYPRPILEFLLDTTRAVSNMVLNGTLAKYPNIRVIVPHCGSALPSIADRIAGFAGIFPLGGQQPHAIDVIGTLQRLTYEVGAGYPFPRQFPGLLSLVDPAQIVYGSDFPYGGLPGIQANVESLYNTPLLKEIQLRGILRFNALRLFPRLLIPQ
jgi:predicted TIM-barrel fold metal-dependent hydrolase